MYRALLAVALAAGVTYFVAGARSPLFPSSEGAAQAPPSQRAAQPPTRNVDATPLYDRDAEHIWNRLDRQLRVRTARGGATYGADNLDPLLWAETRHLLTPPSHAATLAVLDEFLTAHAERLVRDPVRRAVFQRDLWAVFDWTVSRADTHPAARHELAQRLARIIRRVALPPNEIAALPDTYSATLAGARYPTAYDPEHRDRAFLPAALSDSAGPWIPIHGSVPVEQHNFEMSRSSFRVLINLPGGRAATLAHLKRLWNAQEPFVVDRTGSFGGETRTILNPALQALPPGTHIALVRRMLVIDSAGDIRQTPIVESVQMRVFRQAEPCRTVICGHNDQDFFEFVLSRAGLFSSAASGVRAVEPDEEGFLTFSSHGIDHFEPEAGGRLIAPMQMCVNCHHEPGLASVRSSRRLFRPYTFADGGGPAGDGMPEMWKSWRADWGYLQALWQSEPR